MTKHGLIVGRYRHRPPRRYRIPKIHPGRQRKDQPRQPVLCFTLNTKSLTDSVPQNTVGLFFVYSSEKTSSFIRLIFKRYPNDIFSIFNLLLECYNRRTALQFNFCFAQQYVYSQIRNKTSTSKSPQSTSLQRPFFSHSILFNLHFF